MANDGRVLIVDTVIPPGNAPHGGKVLDVMMMASLPGRERTEADFRKLFDRAGLRLSRVVPTPTAMSITEAVAACPSPGAACPNRSACHTSSDQVSPTEGLTEAAHLLSHH